MQKIKSALADFYWSYCEKKMADFETWFWQLWALGTNANGLTRSVLAASSICFLKIIKIQKVQMYLSGINELTLQIQR